jgi:GNAT superfamily N-acetyltransferase
MKPVSKMDASDLVIRMMNDFVVHDYLEEGGWEFLKCIQSNRVMRPFGMKHFVLIAEMEEQIIGTIEIRENNHIALFCVEKKYRQRGIGRKLLQRALELCKKNNPELSEVTVNSLSGSVYIYERLGFRAEKPASEEGDIPCTPMFLLLSKVNNFQTISSDEGEIKASPRWFLSRITDTPTYILYDG